MHKTIDSVFPNLYSQAQQLVERPLKARIGDLLSEDVLEKSIINEDISNTIVNVRAEKNYESSFVFLFENVYQPLNNYKTKVQRNSEFVMNLKINSLKGTPVIVGATINMNDYNSVDESVPKFSLNEDIANIILEEKLDYEGIRIVRLIDNEIDVI
jgi:hypothetical protein